jgi:hypothetical protein
MKTTFCILIIVLLLSSCKEKQDSMSGFIDTNVEISVQDKAGNDLLNPSNQSAYLAQNIKIYYLIDGIKKEINQANLDFTKNFMIYEIDGKYQMRLFLNCSYESTSITYVQWNENDTDTFKTEILKNTNLVLITKLWYNDSMVWNAYDYNYQNYKDRSVKIIK